MLLPAVAMVIRSKNDAALIGETLDAVASQDYPSRVRRIHIDSGSTDGTCEAIERSRPDVFVRIRPEDYIPGQVLNNGMKLSSEPWVVFLNSDAAPQGRDWLSNLLACAVSEPSSGKGVGAAFSRQVPRPDCRAVFAHDYERCYGPRRESAGWPHFFSMVSSVVSRSAWMEQPFREDLKYSEDEEWSLRIKQHGWEIRYAERSAAMHSHNYTVAQTRHRNYGEGFALGATPELARHQSAGLAVAVLSAGRDAAKDLIYCAKRGRLGEWPYAVAVRLAQRLGKRRGFREGLRHYAAD